MATFTTREAWECISIPRVDQSSILQIYQKWSNTSMSCSLQKAASLLLFPSVSSTMREDCWEINQSFFKTNLRNTSSKNEESMYAIPFASSMSPKTSASWQTKNRWRFGSWKTFGDDLMAFWWIFLMAKDSVYIGMVLLFLMAFWDG